MVKAPCAGHVKTRLTPPLTPQAAASLAACFAYDTAAKALAAHPFVTVYYTPSSERHFLKALLPPALAMTPQRGEGLGERMQAALDDAFLQGFSPLVLIGTDSPTLPPAVLAEAVEQLGANNADVVIGPASDGGFYLVGVQKPVPGLFDNVTWSTDRALDQTLRNAAARNLRVKRLPLWYDIDTPDDLDRLRSEMRADGAAARHAERTRAWLARNEDFDHHSDPQ